MIENPYTQEITGVLPRLLAAFDADRTSISYGMGDRYHWAWGLIDFSNGTFQGATHGMARLWNRGLWPYSTSKRSFLARIDALFMAAKLMTRKDGSLEEAFPNEGSYCVTALVSFDLLSTVELLHSEADQPTRVRWLGVVAPMINYLIRSDETHALISNHLATAVAALVCWHNLTDDENAEVRARMLLQRILTNQSTEGWFKEYEGPDPGYQTLCTYYLADIHLRRPDWKLLEPLRRSILFLWHFAHPDGSFGGLYGSRCTRFYYPAGLEALAAEIPEAAALANFMARSIAQSTVVTLSAMDDSNLVPMFNAYCWAATILHERDADRSGAVLPCLSLQDRVDFPQAGIIVDGGSRHYSIISTHKGGVVMHFRDQKLAIHNAGMVVTNPRGKLGSTQAYSVENSVRMRENTVVIRAPITPMPKRLPDTIDFLLLRIFCMTLFRISMIREWFKQRLVHLLIARHKNWPAYNVREVKLGFELTILDKLEAPAGYTVMPNPGSFVPIHMASQGYWQRQDEEHES
jgi:hypothetical protein